VQDGDNVPVEFRAITRDDGARQWAVNGKPLYFFAADVNAGEAKGDGKGGVWHVIRSENKRSATKPAAATQSSSGWLYGSDY
jgi:hypothetical protein